MAGTTALLRRRVQWWDDGRMVEGNWSWPDVGTIMGFTWRDCRLAGVPNQIRTEHLPNDKSGWLPVHELSLSGRALSDSECKVSLKGHSVQE
jgi:hypothetical protein